MHRKFSIFIISLISSYLSTVCYASYDSFENSNICVHKRKIIDLDLKLEDSFSKKHKLACEQAPIHSLPVEILVNIFSELLLYDIINCSQVVKTWYNAYRLLLTSSHVPLFCRYFLGYDKHYEENRFIDISDQEFSTNHLLLDENIFFEIQNYTIHNISQPIYNFPHFNNISKKIANTVVVDKGLPFCIEGVEQHYPLIQQWYRKTFTKFDVIANMNIGYMYEYGKGVQQDFGIAYEWYKKAYYWYKENDRTYLPLIYYRLGRIYERWSHNRNIEPLNNDGPNADDDIVNAKHYYEKAASQNHAGAKHCLDVLKTCQQYNHLFQERDDVYELEFE